MSIRTYEGAVAFITGGASGIGAALGAELKRRGAAEIVLADVQGDLAKKVAKDIGGTAELLDVRDRAGVEACVARTVARTRRLDYVFNNAGTGVWGEAHRQEPKDWDLVADINFTGMLNVVRATYPRLVEQGFGHLVNTASMAGLVASPILALYSATKHAVVGLSKSLRIEGARFGVRVSALCPGVIRTPILSGGAHGRNVYGIPSERLMRWWDRLWPMDVEPFAKQTLDAVAKNEGVIVLPKRNRAFVALVTRIPGLEEVIAKKIVEDTLKQYPEMV
jgi:NAD(P)-dependent dehydrogenase (short-subunit alcohol dehydrogenase family)